MKNALIAILLVSTLGLGAIVFKQKQQKSQAEETIGSFSNKLAEAQGDMDPDKRTEMLEKAQADKDAVNDQIKAFLGEDNYPQFKDYEKTQPERTALGMFKDQQASGPGALTGDQENLLVKALYDERQNFKFTTDFYHQSKFDLSNLDSIFTEEHINKFDQERRQL